MEYIIIGHLTLLTLSIHSYLHNCHLNVFVFILIYNVLMYNISWHFLIYLLVSSSHFASHFKYFRESFFPRNTIKLAITKTHKMGQFYFQTKFINCIFALPFQNTFAKVLKHMNNRTNKVHK